MICVFFFKQKTAYEMRISDWSSDVCSSDLKASFACSPAPRSRSRASYRREGADMAFTDIFIRRPILAIVVSLLILLVGLSATFSQIGSASCRARVCQYV